MGCPCPWLNRLLLGRHRHFFFAYSFCRPAFLMLDGSLIVNLRDDNMTTFQQAYRRIIYQMYVTAARQAKSRLSSLNQGIARV
jgi:hypothetical protein